MTRSQLALRGLLVAASAGLVVVTAVAGGTVLWFVAVPLVLATAYAAARPESVVVLVLLAGHAVHWISIVPVPERVGAWLATLGAAWLLLLVHVAASAATTWPQRAGLPARAMARWTGRTLVVAALTVPVWALAMLVYGRSLQGDVALTYAAFAAVGLLAGGIYLVMRAQGEPRA